MNSQQLRIIIAGAVTCISIVGVIVLAVLSRPIPELLQFLSTGSITFLFGVVTNGSGFGTSATNGSTPTAPPAPPPPAKGP